MGFLKTFLLIFWHISQHKLSVVTSNYELCPRFMSKELEKLRNFHLPPTSLKVLDLQ